MTKGPFSLYLSLADTRSALKARGFTATPRELAEDLLERLWSFDIAEAFVLADWFGARLDPGAARTFEAAGWRVLAPDADRSELARSSKRWIVAAGDESALEPFRLAATELVWLHAEEAPRNARLADAAHDLARVLGLGRRTVVLLVDLENISTAMRERHLPFVPHELARRLVETARSRGRLQQAAAMADWSRLPAPVLPNGTTIRVVDAMRALAQAGIEPVFVLGKPGHNSADIALVERARQVLGSPSPPGRLIIASGDADFLTLLEEARRAGTTLEFWSFRGSTSQRLASEVEIQWLDELLQHDVSTEPVRKEPERSADNRLVAMVLHGLLVRNGWSFASFKWLQRALEGRGHLPEGPDAARMVIERAAAEGAVRMEVIERPGHDGRSFQEHRVVPATGTRLWQEILTITRAAEHHARRRWDRTGSALPVQLVRDLAQDRDLVGLGLAPDERDAWTWLELLLTAGLLERVVLPDPAQPGQRQVSVLPPREAREARSALARSRSSGLPSELLTVEHAASIILLCIRVNPIQPRTGFTPLRDLLNRIVRGIGLPRPLFDQALDHLCTLGAVRLATFPAEGGRRHDVKGVVPLADHPANLQAAAVVDQVLEALAQGNLSRTDLEALTQGEGGLHPDAVVAVLVQHGIASTAPEGDDLVPNPSHPLIARPESTS